METLTKDGVVPVVVLEKSEDAVPAAKALLAGNVHVMEITMRTAAALDSIRAVSAECEDMIVGAGTVINLDQCKACVEAGARFIVSPGFDAATVLWCVENEVPVLPGCVTPTEIMQAMALGLSCFKFFPANIYGGIKAMKALSGPFGKIRFVPTGGVNGENIGDYLKEKFIAAVGGSWLCTAQDIREGHWEKITALSSAATATAAELRG